VSSARFSRRKASSSSGRPVPIASTRKLPPEGDVTVPVPVHSSRPLKKGTLHAILKRTGISLEKLVFLLSVLGLIRSSLLVRLERISDEIARESAAIRARYADPTPRLFPVAVMFLVPKRLL